MNYSWRITKLGLSDELNVDDVLLENAIVRVQWKRIAEDTDGTIASYLGNTYLDVTSDSADDFIALNDVNKTICVGWIEEDLGDAGIALVNSRLDAKIEKIRKNTISPSWG